MQSSVATQTRLAPATTEKFDVVIVGGGPVGMGLAIDLGQRGMRVGVVERYTSAQRVPKGQNLTQRTAEHFRAWGVEQAIRDARVIPREFGIRGLTTYGNLLSEYHYDWFQRDKVAEFYYCENERLPQYETERVLRERVAHLGSVITLYGFECTRVIDRSDVAIVEARHRQNGTTQQLRADYVVGCDGAQSIVRQCAAIEQDSDDHDKHMVLLVFKSQELHALLERYPGKSYFNVINPALDGYWQFFGRVDLGESFFFHAPVATDVTADNHDFHQMLCEIVGQSIQVEFEHIGFWDLRIATAREYGRGRLFVAGDAAHSHPPYGGFGINTGFEDARNLGWKLAAVFAGWAGDGLLASYSQERRAVFQSTAKDFINRYIESDREFINSYDPLRDLAGFEAAWQQRSQGSDFDVVGFAPHYSGSPIVRGESYPDTSVASGANANHEKRARAGHHLTPLMLDETTNVYDRLGPDFTLLHSSDAADAAFRFKQAATRQGVPLRLVQDVRGEAMAGYEASLVLVRPDQYVGWVRK